MDQETTEAAMHTDLDNVDRCSVCGAPFQDTGKKQQCRRCGMFANLCCDPQMPVDLGQKSEPAEG